MTSWNSKALALLALAAGIGTRAQSQTLAVAGGDLPSGTVGVAYTYVFSASGGAPPYRWGLAGTLPATFSFNVETGTLSGTPDARGTFAFTVQVIDAVGAAAKRTLSLVVNPPPLRIATESPLFSGSTGQFYSQVFQASGGTPPYRWAVTAGQLPAGLIFDTSGALTGTPSAPGKFTLTIQVSDSSLGTLSKQFEFSVELPRLTITPSTLPTAVAGAAYSQKLTATGGSPPYTWTSVGTAPGMSVDSSTGILAGIPSTPGSFSMTVQVKDASGATAAKSMTLIVAPAPLLISTGRSIPDGTIGAPYTFAFTATGGAPPFSWSANGLPDGLVLDAATGAITGSPSVGGTLVFTVKVTDSAHTSTLDLFHLNVVLPGAPKLFIKGLPPVSAPADQPPLQVTIGAPYPVTISGQLSLSFAPEIGIGDTTIQFLGGGRTADFTIPAGATEAVFPLGAMAIQTGTVAGTITISARFSAGGVDLTPDPAPSSATQCGRAAPVITAVAVTRNATGFDVLITGFSTAREVTQAVFRFTAASGSALDNPQLTVAVDQAFSGWYSDTASVRYGSQFTFIQPFTVRGDAAAVTVESVMLTNRFGGIAFKVN